MPHPRLATWVDRLHASIVVFWLGGFALYWHFPAFRYFHAWFLVAAGAHQLLLGNRCILTIVSDRLRGPKTVVPDSFFLDNCLGRLGIKLPHWFNTAVTALTVLVAIATLIFWR